MSAVTSLHRLECITKWESGTSIAAWALVGFNAIYCTDEDVVIPIFHAIASVISGWSRTCVVPVNMSSSEGSHALQSFYWQLWDLWLWGLFPLVCSCSHREGGCHAAGG